MISKDEALKLIEKTSRCFHSLNVSDIMRKLAFKLGEDETKWELVGLLHDLDYDQVKNNWRKHGIVANEMLKGKLPDDCLYAIKSHDHRAGFKPKNNLDKALIIADSLAIVIEKMKDVTINFKILKAEIEKISVKEPWLKENILKCEEIGISGSELLKIVAS